MSRAFLVTGLLFVLAGCSGGAPGFVPVSGKVTLDNKPLVNATVIFFPDTEDKNPGPGSQGKTNANGEFVLRPLNGQGEGALVGTHKVTISAYEGDDGAVPSSSPDSVFRKPLLGPEYNAETKLSFEVPAGGTTSADFPLKSK